MRICPHKRRTDLPCPYPDCHATVHGERLHIPRIERERFEWTQGALTGGPKIVVDVRHPNLSPWGWVWADWK